MRGRHKKWALPYLEEHPEFALKELNKDDPFFLASYLALEIGSGKGDFLLSLAAKNPERHYLALEREISIAGILAKKASETPNIRLVAADFDAVYESLSQFSFDVIFLNFSDPWPKKRHEKRRLTTEGRLRKYLSLLKEGGELRIKTDNPILYEFTVEELAKVPELEVISNETHYEFDEENDAMSEYERNFREQGKNIYRIIVRRK